VAAPLASSAIAADSFVASPERDRAASRSCRTGPATGDLVIQRFQLRRNFVKALLGFAVARTEASSSLND